MTVLGSPRPASAPLDLSVALSRNPFLRPLGDGEIQVEGVSLRAQFIHPAEIFLRQLRDAEFDVSEMSLSSLARLVAQGDDRWIAIPAFPFRTFFHTWMLVSSSSTITGPEDLRGKRIGVPEYVITGAVWTRGVLQHEFGIAPSEVTWVVDRRADQSHGGASGFVVPPGVRIEPVAGAQSVGQLMARGEVDALAVPIRDPSALDPTSRWLEGAITEGAVRPLFPDPIGEGNRYRAATGLVHINHTIVVRRSIAEQRPEIALRLLAACALAKRRALVEGRQFLAAYLTTGELDARADVVEQDPLPYGLAANRPIIETLLSYLGEQGLTGGQVRCEDLFAESTLDT